MTRRLTLLERIQLFEDEAREAWARGQAEAEQEDERGISASGCVVLLYGLAIIFVCLLAFVAFADLRGGGHLSWLWQNRPLRNVFLFALLVVVVGTSFALLEAWARQQPPTGGKEDWREWEAEKAELETQRRIPERVRREVWRRDGGQCARCGSRVRLEFDHIVPVSKGGSNTARNIELLCEHCNRSKGAKIE